MNSIPDPSPVSPSHGSVIRIGAVCIAIGAACIAALILKPAPTQKTAKAIATAMPARAQTVDEILASIPTEVGNPQTNKELVKNLVKIRKMPQDAVAWVNLGDTLAQVQRDTSDAKIYAHAEAVYLHALELNPKSAGAMTGMAWVTGGRHTFDQSIAWAERALAVDAGNAAALGILGDASVELGDYEKALDQYQKMMDLRPDLSSWSRGAHLLWLTGEKAKATWLMGRAIKAGAPFAENTAWCRAKLAMMYFQEGAYGAGAEVLEPALAAGTRNVHVLLAAGHIAAAEMEYAAARKYYETILEAGSNHEALTALGDLAARDGDAESAEKFYAQVEALHAVQLVGGGHDHMQMAKFYADHDRNLPEALRMAEQHKLTRNVTEAGVLAWVYFKNRDYARAAEASQRALSHHTPDAGIHFHAGMIAEATGDHAAAQRHLQRALAFSPQFSVHEAPLAAKALELLSGPKPVATTNTP